MPRRAANANAQRPSKIVPRVFTLVLVLIMHLSIFLIPHRTRTKKSRTTNIQGQNTIAEMALCGLDPASSLLSLLVFYGVQVWMPQVHGS